MFRNRSVIEILVITFTMVIAFAIIGLGVLIIVVEFKNPEADTTLIAHTLMGLVSAILGALLGLLAGRTTPGSGDDLHRRPRGDDDGVEK